MPEGERRLAAIMFTDIVGYTALTQSNESQAMEVLERHNRLLRPFFPRFHGKEVKTIGDAFLVEFENALDAVKCAIEIQSYLHDYNVSSKEDWKIKLRIGVHLGDVIRKEGDVFGDAVNIASRIQPVAGPEGICVSRQVYDQVHNKLESPLVSLGEKSLKNVSGPVEVYAVKMPWDQLASREVTPLPRDRIAILPFRNMSPDPNDEYFAEGITEEIISTVSGISGLSVISRTSVMKYKGGGKDISEIGKELRVGSVLEGSFRKAGNKIRVTTQLIDVGDDRHLWAQNYDRNLDDVFEVQSDVARQVADALRVKILSSEEERIERKPTDSTTAYTFYLKGRYLWNKRGFDELNKARELFEQSVKEDPGFALGYVGQADCCLILRDTYKFEREANLSRAKRMVERALELNADLAEAHATKGLAAELEYDVRLAEVEFKKAIELKPSYATAHQWYCTLLMRQLRWEDARGQIEKALGLDPLSAIINYNQGAYYEDKREYARAIEPYRRSSELGYAIGHWGLAAVYGELKMFDDMKREYATCVELFNSRDGKADRRMPWRLAADLRIACFEDDRQAVFRLLPELESHFQSDGMLDASYISRFHFYLGQYDRAFEWLERAYSRREGALSDIRLLRELDGVRTDPRYLDLLKRLGLD